MSVRKMGRCGIIAAYTGFANGVNVGALMEKGVRLIGNGQAPVHKYWEEILSLIQEGKFDPTLWVICTYAGMYGSDHSLQHDHPSGAYRGHAETLYRIRQTPSRG